MDLSPPSPKALLFLLVIFVPTIHAGIIVNFRIDDAPVLDHEMTPHERMKALSKQFHASHSGPGSMVNSAPHIEQLSKTLDQLGGMVKEAVLTETPVDNPNKPKEKVDFAEQMRKKLKVQNQLQKFREDMAQMGRGQMMGGPMGGQDEGPPVHSVGEMQPGYEQNLKYHHHVKREVDTSNTQDSANTPEGRKPIILNRQGVYNRVRRSAAPSDKKKRSRNPRVKDITKRKRRSYYHSQMGASGLMLGRVPSWFRQAQAV